MKRMIIVTTAFVVVGVGSFLTAERFGWFSEAQVFEWMTKAGWKGALMGMALLMGDVVLPVPSSVVMTLHGVGYGVVWGTVYSTAGSLGCAWIGFALGRLLGGKAVDQVGASEEDVSFAKKFFDRFGPYAIMLSRPVPIFAEVMTCLAGMEGLSWKTFSGAALCGALPLSAVYAVWGARSGQVQLLLPALIVAVLIPAIGWTILSLVSRKS